MDILQPLTNWFNALFIELRKLTGGYGTYFFSDTGTHTVNFTVITPTEDTVIAELYTSSAPTINVVATANTDVKYNFASRTLTTADLITCHHGAHFTKIKNTSGAVRLN